MGRKFTVTTSGFCPETNQYTQIQVTFEELNMVGSKETHCRKVGILCDHYSKYGCLTCGPDGSDCPLFRAVRNP